MPREWNATYRLQLTPEFGFREARELVPYLQELGITTIELLPLGAIGHVPWWPADKNEVTLHHILIHFPT